MGNRSGVRGVIGKFGFSLNESFEPLVDPLYQGSKDRSTFKSVNLTCRSLLHMEDPQSEIESIDSPELL